LTQSSSSHRSPSTSCSSAVSVETTVRRLPPSLWFYHGPRSSTTVLPRSEGCRRPRGSTTALVVLPRSYHGPCRRSTTVRRLPPFLCFYHGPCGSTTVLPRSLVSFYHGQKAAAVLVVLLVWRLARVVDGTQGAHYLPTPLAGWF